MIRGIRAAVNGNHHVEPSCPHEKCSKRNILGIGRPVDKIDPFRVGILECAGIDSLEWL